jgi:hypothetical protein
MAKRVLNGDDVRSVFESVLPDEDINQLIRKLKFQQRDRKLDGVRPCMITLRAWTSQTRASPSAADRA